MERDEGEVSEHLDIHMAKITWVMDFLITLTSHNAEMQVTKPRVSNELLSHRLGLLELKLERL